MSKYNLIYILANEKTVYDLTSATKTLIFMPAYEDKKEIIQNIYYKLEKMEGYH